MSYSFSPLVLQRIEKNTKVISDKILNDDHNSYDGICLSSLQFEEFSEEENTQSMNLLLIDDDVKYIEHCFVLKYNMSFDKLTSAYTCDTENRYYKDDTTNIVYIWNSRLFEWSQKCNTPKTNKYFCRY